MIGRRSVEASCDPHRHHRPSTRMNVAGVPPSSSIAARVQSAERGAGAESRAPQKGGYENIGLGRLAGPAFLASSFVSVHPEHCRWPGRLVQGNQSGNRLRLFGVRCYATFLLTTHDEKSRLKAEL